MSKGSHGGRAVQVPGGWGGGPPPEIVLVRQPDVVVRAGDPRYHVRWGQREQGWLGMVGLAAWSVSS